MNGEGGAIQIKKYLEDSLELQDIDIVPLSMNNHKELLFKINELRKRIIFYVQWDHLILNYMALNLYL